MSAAQNLQDSNEDGLKHSQSQGAATVFCLCIDLFGATKYGIELTKSQFNRFNAALVKQIRPHLEFLSLEDVVLKFTGDGWLVMTLNTNQLDAICCLALIMAGAFQKEISEESVLPECDIPPLRLAICFGHDLRVELPDGRPDWVGDSARRATRCSGFCYENEVLIDEVVRSAIFRDFTIENARIEQRESPYRPKAEEEHLILHTLQGIKPGASQDKEAPNIYIYTLKVLGRVEEAKRIYIGSEETLNSKVQDLDSSSREMKNTLTRSWNQLLRMAPDYNTGFKTLKRMKTSGLAPNVVTYNTLMSLSGDYPIAQTLFEEMKKDGIAPNVVTYSTLMSLSGDYPIAQTLFEEMKKDGIAPNVVTYSTLMSLSGDYPIAQTLFKEMKKDGIAPNVFTYSTLMSLSGDYPITQTLFEEMKKDGIAPNVVTYNTLMSVSGDYPIAQTLFKEMKKDGIAPNVFTYSTLMSLSGDYPITQTLFEEMKKDSIAPNVVTYNTLMSVSGDYPIAQTLFEEMKNDGIAPDVRTYNTLILLSEDYATAKIWFNKMNKDSVSPSIATYEMLFSKDLSSVDPVDLVEWYLNQEFHPEAPMDAAIASYRKHQRIEQALLIVIDYPFLDAGRKVIRDYGRKAIEFYRLKLLDPDYSNKVKYILGLTYCEIGEKEAALPLLQEACKNEPNLQRREKMIEHLTKYFDDDISLIIS